MTMNKQAAEAVNMLIEQGIDFDTASAMVMEKVAGDGASIYWNGAAETERRIAKQYGKEGPGQSLSGDLKQNLGASGRAGGRGILTAAAGAAGGFLGGRALASRAIRRGATTVANGKAFTIGSTVAGYLGGYGAGVAQSFKNQAKEMHEKYREKQAAVNMLVDNGIDFDSALDLVNAKAQELYGD